MWTGPQSSYPDPLQDGLLGILPGSGRDMEFEWRKKSRRRNSGLWSICRLFHLHCCIFDRFVFCIWRPQDVSNAILFVIYYITSIFLSQRCAFGSRPFCNSSKWKQFSIHATLFVKSSVQIAHYHNLCLLSSVTNSISHVLNTVLGYGISTACVKKTYRFCRSLLIVGICVFFHDVLIIQV